MKVILKKSYLYFHQNNMVKNLSSSKKLMKLLHKFNRYNKRERLFVGYLFVLLFCLLFLPIVKVTSLRGTWWYGVWLWKPEFFKTMLIVFTSVFVLIGRNLSFKFNFLFLFIITTSFFAITDTISVSSWVTSRVVVSRGGKFVQVILLIGIVMTLVSVIKSAQETWKKTKIINMVDEDHKKIEHTKDDIKKWLFDK